MIEPCASSLVGLSPRVRGNRLEHGLKQVGQGSIPACAGEPPAQPNCGAACGVYPRVCGGTCGPDGFEE